MINFTDPFEIEHHIESLNLVRPQFLYLRRNSCQCTSCRPQKNYKGLQLVLEEELKGEYNEFLKTFRKANRILKRVSMKANVNFENEERKS